MIIYKIARGAMWLYCHTLFKIEIKGKENIPKSGAAIVCANHMSMFDPVIIAVSMERMLNFMAKKELFKSKFLGWLFRQLGAFPVDRENVGIDTLKETMNVLKDGKVLGIFAQSGRRKTVDESDAKAGVAMFAVRTGAVVVPVGIQATYKLFSTVKVNVGEPMDFTKYKGQKLRTAELNELTSGIMSEVKRLAGE